MLASAACWLAGVPAIFKWVAPLVAAASCAARWPAESPSLVLRHDGLWDLPSQRLFDLRLGSGTRYTRLWAKLELVDDTRRVNILLLADQLEAVTWSLLQARLRGDRGERDLTSSSSRSV